MVALRDQGSRVYFTGNTFPIKDKIKAIGGHWDGDAKAWWVGVVKRQEAEQLVSLGSTQAAAAAKTETGTATAKVLPDDTRVLGRADYKGKSYLWLASMADHSRYLLAFSDGSKSWWADAAQVNVTKRYEPMEYRGQTTYQTIGSLRRFAEKLKRESTPEYRANAPTQQCWECGRQFTESDARRNNGDWRDSYCGC